MPHAEGQRSVTVVSACMRRDGFPDFALTEVEVTADEHDNGAHYALAEASLAGRGYEGPFVHFDQHEAPGFLLPAVREHLGLTTPDAVVPAAP